VALELVVKRSSDLVPDIEDGVGAPANILEVTLFLNETCLFSLSSSV